MQLFMEGHTTVNETLAPYQDYLTLRGIGKDYLVEVKTFLTYCENESWNYRNITIEQFTTFLLNYKNNNPGTVNNYIKALRSFYTYLLERDICTPESKDAIYKIKYLRTTRKMKDYLTEHELDRLITKVTSYGTYLPGYKARAILLLLFYTGLRKMEFIHLMREDIDVDGMKAIVRLPNKAKKEDYVYFNKRTHDALKDYFATEPQRTNAFNITPFQLKNFVDTFNRDFKKRISTHTFRYSFAMLLAEKKCDVRRAQGLLRHNSIHSTLIYFQPTPQMLEEAYREKIK